jgi:hypothetical protein
MSESKPAPWKCPACGGSGFTEIYDGFDRHDVAITHDEPCRLCDAYNAGRRAAFEEMRDRIAEEHDDMCDHDVSTCDSLVCEICAQLGLIVALEAFIGAKMVEAK